jgi:hypothetical protein
MKQENRPYSPTEELVESIREERRLNENRDRRLLAEEQARRYRAFWEQSLFMAIGQLGNVDQAVRRADDLGGEWRKRFCPESFATPPPPRLP